jgi:hypothetical protein
MCPCNLIQRFQRQCETEADQYKCVYILYQGEINNFVLSLETQYLIAENIGACIVFTYLIQLSAVIYNIKWPWGRLSL